MATETTRQRIIRLQIELPEPPVPRGQYEAVIVHNGIASVSGQVSRHDDGVVRGPATPSTSPDVIASAARMATLRAVSALESAVGDLDAVEQLVFVRGFIFSSPDFVAHSLALDVASTLLMEIFGARGAHGRSAVGVASLPDGALLELEVTAAIRHLNSGEASTSRVG